MQDHYVVPHSSREASLVIGRASGGGKQLLVCVRVAVQGACVCGGVGMGLVAAGACALCFFCMYVCIYIS